MVIQRQPDRLPDRLPIDDPVHRLVLGRKSLAAPPTHLTHNSVTWQTKLELSTTLLVNKQMKRDGRTLGHETLEEMRKLAVRRMNEGERSADLAASFGLHCSWAFKCRATAKGRGKGLRALNEQLQAVVDDPALVRSFFGHPSVAYVSDGRVRMALPLSGVRGP